MKKTLLAQVAILTMLATTGAKAQYGSEYYHRTGDTIVGRPNNGYFVCWGFDDLIRERRGVEFDYTSYTDMISYEYILMKFYTPTPLRIVGLAGVSGADRGNILLYDATPAGNILKDSVTWNSSDSTFRYLEVKYPKFLAFTDSCCSPTAAILTSTCKLHECYFD